MGVVMGKMGPYSKLVIELGWYDDRARISAALADAVRGGLSGEQIRCAVHESGCILPEGVMSFGRMVSGNIADVSDSWLRYWCHLAPRVLVSASHGRLVGVALDGREYTQDEADGVAALCLTAQCEDINHWITWQQWATDVLYPEYRRRFDKDHACRQRVVETSYHYPEW